MTKASSKDTNILFHYDMDGIRDSKEINGVKHDYVTQGGNVALDTWTDKSGKHRMEFVYDNSGSPYSVILDGKTYYYVLNHLGDVVRIVDESGNTVTEYVYNSWGEILNETSVNKTMIGKLNPLRYRSYYYDIETGMYYLQNRYYDPTVKRMLNADAVGAVTGKIGTENMFSYCGNNPVNNTDATGNLFQWIKSKVKKVKKAIKNVASKVVKKVKQIASKKPVKRAIKTIASYHSVTASNTHIYSYKGTRFANIKKGYTRTVEWYHLSRVGKLTKL